MEMNLNSAQISDMSNKVENIIISSKNTDGISNQKETIWINQKWSKYWGYFNAVSDLKSAILMKSIWNVGKGYTCENPEDEVILENIKGWGKDTFEDILFNMDVIQRIGGESYCEIIRDENTGILLNLKPLDPASMKIIVNEQGTILRFEQINKIINIPVKSFKPHEILYFAHNRLADQIHGISDIESIEKTILAEYENFEDMKKVMHRQARPLIMFRLGTDNEAQIASFIGKMDNAVNKGENIYIPDDGNTVNYEVIQVNVSQMIMEWRTDIRNKFYRALGLPLIIFGSGGTTESGGKMEYLAHEQVFEHDQRYIEKQIWNQLGIKINLIPPTSMVQNLYRDSTKDGNAQQLNLQPNDIMAGIGK
jgi:hypothetical protein